MSIVTHSTSTNNTMKIVSDLTNALTKRPGKTGKPTTDTGDKKAVKPQRIGRSARNAQKAIATAENQVSVEPVLLKGRSTRGKAKPAEEDEIKKDTEELMPAETVPEEVKTDEVTKGAPKQKKSTADKATKTKEVPKKASTTETATTEIAPVPEVTSTKSSEKSSTEGELETAMASMALGDDENMEVEASQSSPPSGRMSRFGRKLLTPKKYKDYLLGAARRNPSST